MFFEYSLNVPRMLQQLKHEQKSILNVEKAVRSFITSGHKENRDKKVRDK
jgi:hypothetical protein